MVKIKVLFLTMITFIFLTVAGPALAQDPEPSYDQINDIAENLNCPTCTGINLADCRTLTCEQWREKIGDLVAEGYNKEEVLDYFSTRYGPQVLQEPPRSGFTLILWLLPVIALLAGGIWLFFTMRNWSRQEAAPVGVESAAGLAVPPAPDTASSEAYLSQVEKDLGLE
jgi:cytochrome c-type biogenesis protein CcmH